MHSYDIVGYTFAADIYCPACISEVVLKSYQDEPEMAEDMNEYTIWDDPTETTLHHFAEALGIDYLDEYSYDSDDFPKVIFCDSVESDEEICGNCHDSLIGD